MNIPMKTALIADPIDVVNRLDTLGWRREDLLEVVESMVGARNSCTENDPPGAPGWKSWCDGTRRLREIGTLMGLERDEEGQISSVHDKKRGIKFAVCNTDDGTGLEYLQPQNRSRKGAATDRAVSKGQSVFKGILEESVNVVQLPEKNEEGVVYWYLCVFCEGDEVRAELSCPAECEAGFFKSFRERIILVAGGNNDGGVHIKPENSESVGPEFEIKVTRKQA